MKRIIFFLMFCSGTQGAVSQTTDCDVAVYRLQSYAQQVNEIYRTEYWNIIPNQRCPAVDAWNRPYNPIIVQNCRNQMLWNLNIWYGQQVNQVNSWYAQIVRGCMESPSTVTGRPGPGKVEREGEAEPIDDSEIEELTAGIDEEKAVRITIPRTAAGFRPRQ